MDIIKKTMEKQEWLEDKARGLGKGKYARVIKMAVKPTEEEYSKSLLITGIGIAIIGLMGFIIFLMFKYIPQFLEWLINI